MHAEEGLNECGILLAAEAGTAHSTKGSGDGWVGNANGISGIVSTGLGARWLSSAI
jgi:hypothetical protein